MPNNLKKLLSKRKIVILLCSAVLGLFIIFSFSGKSRTDIEAITVSPDEKYIAYFETGRGYKIRCFHSDTSLSFEFDVPSDVSAGGHCTLWFEDDVLCVFFYRTDKIAKFSLDGAMLCIADYKVDKHPPEFPSFIQKGHQYIYEGREITVVYDQKSFLGYWFFNSERYLAITTTEGKANIVDSWSASDRVKNSNLCRCSGINIGCSGCDS